MLPASGCGRLADNAAYAGGGSRGACKSEGEAPAEPRRLASRFASADPQAVNRVGTAENPVYVECVSGLPATRKKCRILIFFLDLKAGLKV